MVPISSVRISRVPTYSGYRSRLQNFAYGAFTRFGLPFQVIRLSIRLLCCGPYPNPIIELVWAAPISLATTLGITICFLFLQVLRCFSSLGSPHAPIYSVHDNTTLLVLSFLIRTSADQNICFSPQLIAACHVLLRRYVPRHSPVCSS